MYVKLKTEFIIYRLTNTDILKTTKYERLRVP